jgi:hypothetical protein
MATFAANCLVDTLANKVSLKCLNPSSQNTFQAADIVSLMDDEMNEGVVPLLKSTSQEYFVMNVDVPIVQGQSAYTFPQRAIGNALRDVVLVDSAGNEVALNNLMREYVKVSFPFTFVPTIWTFGQYQTANEINLFNTMVQTYTSYKLRFITERRPGGLTLSTNCGQVTGITGSVVTLSSVDPSWTTATTFDAINQLPPFQTHGDDIAISLINGLQVTVTNLPSSVAIGDWFCPAGLSCIPQIPYEMFPLLTERTVATLAQALDMSQLLAASKAKIQEFEEKALKLARPRVKGSPRLIIGKDNVPHLGFGGMGGGFSR